MLRNFPQYHYVCINHSNSLAVQVKLACPAALFLGIVSFHVPYHTYPL